MNRNFRRLKYYLVRLNTVVNELESLEDFEGENYRDVTADIGCATMMLEQRRELLQKRGRTQ